MSDVEKKPPRKGASRRAGARGGEGARAGTLWAKCPECRMPVEDAKLFKHLLNCPGAEARQAEWAAQQAVAKAEGQTDAATSPE